MTAVDRDAERPYRGFGETLARLREEAGLTRPELARDAGIGYPMMSHLESGRRRASDEMMEKLAHALGLHGWKLRDLRLQSEIDATETKLADLLRQRDDLRRVR